MKRFYLFVVVLSILASCDKPIEYNQTLGLLSEYNVLSAAGGSTDVAVFSNTAWSVKFQSPAQWASIDRLSGEGCGRVIFDYEQNFGRPRRVIMEFKAGDKVMTLNMYQNAAIADEDVEMKVLNPSLDVLAEGVQAELGLQTNLIYDLERFSLNVVYGEESVQEDWVHLVDVTSDKVILKVDQNQTGSPRVANVRLAHSAEGVYNSTIPEVLYSNVITINQQ